MEGQNKTETMKGDLRCLACAKLQRLFQTAKAILVSNCKGDLR
jgi:hypothetical protein